MSAQKPKNNQRQIATTFGVTKKLTKNVMTAFLAAPILETRTDPRRTYLPREASGQNEFGSIKVFYSPSRKHTNNGVLSSVDYAAKQQRINGRCLGNLGAPQSFARPGA